MVSAESEEGNVPSSATPPEGIGLAKDEAHNGLGSMVGPLGDLVVALALFLADQLGDVLGGC
jgi:hypothetical protein